MRGSRVRHSEVAGENAIGQHQLPGAARSCFPRLPTLGSRTSLALFRWCFGSAFGSDEADSAMFAVAEWLVGRCAAAAQGDRRFAFGNHKDISLRVDHFHRTFDQKGSALSCANRDVGHAVGSQSEVATKIALKLALMSSVLGGEQTSTTRSVAARGSEASSEERVENGGQSEVLHSRMKFPT
jgi:hypothetical protein